jgi:hypothetical protein
VGEIYKDLKKLLEHKSIAIDRSNELTPSFWTHKKAHANKYVSEGQNYCSDPGKYGAAQVNNGRKS